MKNIFKRMVLVSLFSAIMVSCFTEYMEPVPKTSISDLTAFDTRARIVAQVNGLYAAVKSGLYLGGRYQVYNDIRGDDFLNHQANGVTGLMTWNHNLSPTSDEVQNLWLQVYFSINRFNLFLEGMEANRERILGANMLSEAEYNQFIGEALALRGMAYFHLSMLYARPFNQDRNGLGMILRITAQKDDTGNDMARSTIAETYDQIISDLTTAMPLLPLTHGGTGNSVLNVTRMQRNTVIALLTRVYLHQSNYDAVLAEGNKIVPATAPFVAGGGGVAYALAPAFATIFASPYTSAESIFSIPMTPTELPGTQNQLGHYFSIGPAGNLEYSINTLSPVWANTTVFPAGDARRLLTRTATVGGVSRVFLHKYPAFPHTDYAPVIRYAEVLLNVAEAEVRVNRVVTPRAVALLNAVYGRSNPGGRVYTVGDFTSIDVFVARLMLERNMEFLGEGIRNMDITRKVAPFGAKGGVPAVPHTSTAYVWPIPQTELNTNRLVQQN